MQHTSQMQSHEFNIYDTSLRAWIGGSGPAILLLHSGYGDAQFSWKSVWEDLAESFTVIAPDMPGFGKSELGAAENASDVVALLAELTHQVTAGPVVVVGNSFGGGIAYRLAQEFPELVSKLVLVNGTAMQEIPAWFRSVLKWPIVHDAFIRLGQSLFYSDRALRGAFNDADALPESFRISLQKNAFKHSEISGDIWLNSEPNHTRVQAPIALIWGAEDQMTPIKLAEKIKEEYPSASLYPIDYARHMPELEQPHIFVSTLKYEAMTIP